VNLVPFVVQKIMSSTSSPVTPIIETFRAGFLGAGTASWARLGYSGIFVLVVMFIGVVIFNRVEKTFIDTV